jgi:periplasmic copper chaperone A
MTALPSRARAALVAVAAASAPIMLAGATAEAHVEVKPKRVTAGRTTTLRISVENEISGARTVKIDIRMPPGLERVEPKTTNGWRFELHRAGASVTRMTISATSAASGISGGGTIRSFAFRAKVPGAPGTLSFKAVQIYDNGDVVRWIGPPGTSEPAATLKVEAAGQPSTPSGTTGTTTTTTLSSSSSSSDDGGGLSTGAIIAIVAGALLVLGGAFAAIRARRRPS